MSQSDMFYLLNHGDTAWMLMSTICGLLLGPALAYAYGQMTGYSTELVKLVVVSAAMISVLWIVFTFSLVYGTDANGDGIIGYPDTYYMFFSIGGFPIESLAPTIPSTIFAIFELGFPIVSAAIVASAVIGRVNSFGFLFFIFVWHICIYCPVMHMTYYRRGWFTTSPIEDYAGGIVLNMLASITALSIHIVLGYSDRLKPVVCKRPQATLTGMLAVWFLWFAFLSGKAHNAGPVAAQSIVNTIAASAGGIVAWYLLDLYFDRPTTSVSLATSLVLSLVGICPAAGVVTVGGALCLSIFVTMLTYLISRAFLGEMVQPNEPMSILTLHSAGGVFGMVFTAIFSYRYINTELPAMNGLTNGSGDALANNLAVICAMYSACFICCLLCAFICNFLVPLGSSPEIGRASL